MARCVDAHRTEAYVMSFGFAAGGAADAFSCSSRLGRRLVTGDGRFGVGLAAAIMAHGHHTV